MKRQKNKEFIWVDFLENFFVKAYKMNSRDGNTYIVYAHNYTDAKTLYSARLNIPAPPENLVYYYEESDIAPFLNWRKEQVMRPFWYYGRVYLVEEKDYKKIQY